MPRRNGWRSGDHLVQDEESGRVIYASRAREDWRGLIVDKRYADKEHPQYFVEPGEDPYPVEMVSRIPDTLTLKTSAPTTAGRNTGVVSPRGAAYHLFTPDD